LIIIHVTSAYRSGGSSLTNVENTPTCLTLNFIHNFVTHNYGDDGGGGGGGGGGFLRNN